MALRKNLELTLKSVPAMAVAPPVPPHALPISCDFRKVSDFVHHRKCFPSTLVPFLRYACTV
ncbi:hypothetical protein TELCIR_18011, partial [Teladorsagia circumcincta]